MHTDKNLLDPSNRFLNATAFCLEFIRLNKVQITADGKFRPNSKWAAPGILLDKLVTDYDSAFTMAKLTHNSKLEGPFKWNKFSREVLQAGLSQAIEAARTVVFKNLVDELNQPPSDPLSADKWALAAFDNCQPHDIAAFKHFLWQVKRKLNELPVTYHLMLNITGPQGGGKTSAVSTLLSPLGSLVQKRKLKELSDDRSAYLMGRIAVVLCEELAGGSNADIESLKALITAEDMSSRRLGTNSDVTNAQNVTLISTANISVAEVIADSTGMRRFYEVNFSKAYEACWAELAKLDTLDIWRSVDHNHEPYTLAFKDVILSKQLALVRPDLIEMWLDNIQLTFTDGTTGTPQKTVLEDIKNFSDAVQRSSYSSASKLHQSLSRILGSKLKTFKKDRINHYNFTISEISLTMKGPIG